MPSAVMKPEKKACVEAEEPIKQALNVIEKKIRNLEKRRGKLEEYRARAKGGAKLNDDQKKAVAHYESVLASIEFAKELTKQFVEIQEKTEKLMKKKVKLEQKMQHMEEASRMQEVLRLQNLLDSMGSDEVREHFKKGTNGAIALSEENLTQLDELYKLISPTRDGETSYAEQLVAAAEHLSCFVEDKEKEVVGTTYKDLRELVKKVADCGYFDKTASSEEEPVVEQTEDTSEDQQEEAAIATIEVESEPVPIAESTTQQQQPEQHQTPPQQQQSAPAAAMHSMVSDTMQQQQAQQQQQQTQAPITHQPQPASLSYTEQSLSSQLQSQSQSQPMVPEGGVQFGDVVAEEESFFSTMDLTKPRAFTDIVSSVQGSFNFLQDSEIDSQTQDTSAHVDPAVVAARPMPHSQQQVLPPGGASQQSDAYAQPSPYTTATASLQDQMAQLTTQEPVSDVSADPSAYRGAAAADLGAPPQAATQASQYPSQSYDDPPQQTSWATAADQSWGSGAAEHASWVEQTSQPQSWAEQAASSHPPNAWSTNTSQDLSSSGPAPIPLPSETVPGQSLTFNSADNANSFSQVASDSQEKPSNLNPNANVFSMYNEQQGFQSHQQSDYDQRRGGGGKDSYGHDGYQSQGGYRGNQRRDYGSNQQRSGGDRRGGGGGGGRGGGYQGRGGRGGGMGGGRDGGGYRGGQGGGGGGSGSYQNGGRGGNRGNSGMRGGPRGGSGGPRGGPRGGGYGGRPNSGQ